MRTRLFLSIALLCTITQGVWAQTDPINHLSLSLSFLTHGEECSGGLPRPSAGGTLMEDQSHFLYGRTRLILDYDRSGLEFHAVIQNKHVWGMSGNQTLGLYEGWAKLSADNGMFAQLGRIALSYDDGRIIGPNDFATASQSHDVARFGYEGHGHKLHAILAYNQNGDNVYVGTYYNNGAQYYKNMQTVWYHYDVTNIPLGASLLFMNVGQQAGVQGDASNPPSIQYQQMYGGYIKYQPSFMTFEASYYRQTGKEVNSIKQFSPIDAWMASAKATITTFEILGFEMGYDYLSGDDYVPVLYGGRFGMPRHEVHKGFAPLYGSRTEFYGLLDYFYQSAYTNSFTPGLQNAYAGITGKPLKKLSIGATYHYLAVATHLSDLDDSLGHSIELEASYSFTPDITLMVGYTQMKGTETMQRLKQGGSDHANWGWFSLVISPTLLNNRW